MRTRNAIIGAAALGLAAIGCSDDNYGPLNIHGEAAYCVRSTAVSGNGDLISEVGFYVDVDITGGGKLKRLVKSVSVRAFTDSAQAEFFPLYFEDHESRERLHYTAVADERRVLGNVNSMEVSATDNQGDRSGLPLEEVACVTLDQMLGL